MKILIFGRRKILIALTKAYDSRNFAIRKIRLNDLDNAMLWVRNAKLSLEEAERLIQVAINYREGLR